MLIKFKELYVLEKEKFPHRKTQTRTEDEIEIVTELRTKNINNKTWELKGNKIKLKREKTLGQEHKNFTKQK